MAQWMVVSFPIKDVVERVRNIHKSHRFSYNSAKASNKENTSITISYLIHITTSPTYFASIRDVFK